MKNTLIERHQFKVTTNLVAMPSLTGHSYKQLNNPANRRNSMLHRRRWTLLIAALLTVAGFIYFSHGASTTETSNQAESLKSTLSPIKFNAAAINEDNSVNDESNVINDKLVVDNDNKMVEEIIVPEVTDDKKKVEVSGIIEAANDMPSAEDNNPQNSINSLGEGTNEVMANENNQISEGVSVINDVPVDTTLAREPSNRRRIETLSSSTTDGYDFFIVSETALKAAEGSTAEIKQTTTNASVSVALESTIDRPSTAKGVQMSTASNELTVNDTIVDEVSVNDEGRIMYAISRATMPNSTSTLASSKETSGKLIHTAGASDS
uniref:Secreted protein n=1 Tax=Syphacia muris TaxID=451379 RepID=A0A0N5AHM5_9BILA